MSWDVTVYRQRDRDLLAAKPDSPAGIRLAEWHTGGLDWLNDLVKAGKAIDLGGDGYPSKYTAIAKYLFPRIREEDEWSHRLFGKSAADLVALSDCHPDEWLVLEAWDSS